MSDCFPPHGLQHAGLPYPSLSPGVCSNSCPLQSVKLANHLILCQPLLFPSTFTFHLDFPNITILHLLCFFSGGWWLSRSVVSSSLWPLGSQPARLLCPWDSPGKNTGEGCHFLLQGIFPTEESNPGLLHCRQILYQLSYKGSLFLSKYTYISHKVVDMTFTSTYLNIYFLETRKFFYKTTV